MPIPEYVVLRNRTEDHVRFTYDGQGVVVEPKGELIADLEMARWLYSCDAVLALTEDGPAYKLGIEKGPNALLEHVDADCFNCDPIAIKASHEHPDLAASRAVKWERVAVSSADFRPEVTR